MAARTPDTDTKGGAHEDGLCALFRNEPCKRHRNDLDVTPADYRVVTSAKAPDGNLSALLVQRRGHDSLSSDVYYVILADRPEMPNLSRATQDNPILVATHGQNVGIQWSGANALSITCAGCGINPIDIMERKEKVDSVSVSRMWVSRNRA